MRLFFRGKEAGAVLSFLFMILISGMFASSSFAESDGQDLEETSMPLLEIDQPPGSTADNSPETISAKTPETPAAPAKGDSVSIQPASEKTGPSNRGFSCIVQLGGSLPIYDEDFRDFVDYGASISLGLKKKVLPHVYFMPMLGFTLLNGDWDMNQSRELMHVEAQFYNDTSYFGGADAVVENIEFLRSIELNTSMYLFPLTFNVMYQAQDDDAGKISPYVGGGVGFCVARRDVESRSLKEKRYNGPNYYLDFIENQTVFGQILRLFAGLQIPFGKNMKIVVDAETTFYDLKNLDPIMTISYNRPNPDYYPGSDLFNPSLETPVEIGAFNEAIVTSLSIGLVVPF